MEYTMMYPGARMIGVQMREQLRLGCEADEARIVRRPKPRSLLATVLGRVGASLLGIFETGILRETHA